MKRILLLLLIVSSLLSGCKDGGEYIRVHSYVQGYSRIEGIKAYAGTGMDIMLFESGRSDIYQGKSSEYKALCSKHGDTSYKGRILLDNAGIPNFVAQDFVKVDVVSDADYDEKYPAGSLLEARFLTLSAYPYIRNKYKKYDWENSDKKTMFSRHFPIEKWRYRDQLYPIDKMVSELTADDLMVLGCGIKMVLGQSENPANGHYFPLAVLLFETPPTLAKTHTFTVTLTDDEGNVFEDCIEMTFE